MLYTENSHVNGFGDIWSSYGFYSEQSHSEMLSNSLCIASCVVATVRVRFNERKAIDGGFGSPTIRTSCSVITTYKHKARIHEIVLTSDLVQSCCLGVGRQ